jgi:enoyl-CoA hydratase
MTTQQTTSSILVTRAGPVTTITINRPHARNALDAEALARLGEALDAFDRDADAAVGVLTGAGAGFCAGADLKAIATAQTYTAWAGDLTGMLGAPRSKPIIAAVSGHAVAGGLGVALYCDIRIADETAVFGVFCRRFGVPMSDGTTVRLPRLIGESRAMDMMLTGRGVDALEAREMGLVREVVTAGEALTQAQALARDIAAFPPLAMRSDRESLLAAHGLPLEAALRQEAQLAETAKHKEAAAGASRFSSGSDRHGTVTKDT